ncbi:transmembrane amino acid transporter [Geopyxis carbonaria]|nr:transmembrane amino acid transporter [Geopyxis carbonaria]
MPAHAPTRPPPHEQDASLLVSTSPVSPLSSSSSRSSSGSDEDLVVASTPDIAVSTRTRAPSLSAPKLENPSPRTPGRSVRFALDDDDIELQQHSPDAPSWTPADDYPPSDHSDDDDGSDDGRRASSGSMRAPLLRDIEAPSVTVANDYDVAAALQERPKSGMRMAFMNMANSIIGAGIIGQPYAFRQAGLLAGIVLLVALTITVDWTINLIVVNSKLSGANSFQATMQKCFGRSGLIAISVAQWAFAFGGMIAFCIIIGDTIPHVVLAIFPKIQSVPVLGLLANRRAVIVIFTLGISYPLTLYRDIAKARTPPAPPPALAKASAFALASMFIIVLAVVTQGFTVPAASRGHFSPQLLLLNTGIFQAIGVISFAFVCHHNSLLIYGSLRTPTLDRFARVTHYSTGISCAMCLLLATAGFLTFGDKTAGNVLNNFPATNTLVNVARLCFGLNMLTTLPLEAFVCREVMEEYYFPGEPFNLARHMLFSTSLVLGAMSVSLITCDLGAVFELIGATSACALAYILPPICYIRLAKRSWRTWVAAAVAVFGCAVMAISLVQSFVKIARGGGEKVECGF